MVHHLMNLDAARQLIKRYAGVGNLAGALGVLRAVEDRIGLHSLMLVFSMCVRPIERGEDCLAAVGDAPDRIRASIERERGQLREQIAKVERRMAEAAERAAKERERRRAELEAAGEPLPPPRSASREVEEGEDGELKEKPVQNPPGHRYIRQLSLLDDIEALLVITPIPVTFENIAARFAFFRRSVPHPPPPAMERWMQHLASVTSTTLPAQTLPIVDEKMERKEGVDGGKGKDGGGGEGGVEEEEDEDSGEEGGGVGGGEEGGGEDEKEEEKSPLEGVYSVFVRLCVAKGVVWFGRRIVVDMVQAGIKVRKRTLLPFFEHFGKLGLLGDALALRQVHRCFGMRIEEQEAVALLKAASQSVQLKKEKEERERKTVEEEEEEGEDGEGGGKGSGGGRGGEGRALVAQDGGIVIRRAWHSPDYLTPDERLLDDEVWLYGDAWGGEKMDATSLAVGLLDPRGELMRENESGESEDILREGDAVEVDWDVADQTGPGAGMPRCVAMVLADVVVCLPVVGRKVGEEVAALAACPFMRSIGWKCNRVVVGEDGRCSRSGRQLRSLDIGSATEAALAAAVGRLASKNARQTRLFQSFQKWLREQGPYDVIIDGANVGFFNQNYATGGFSHAQIDAVVRHFENEGRRPLLVLHERWFRDGPHLEFHNTDKKKHREFKRGVVRKDRELWMQQARERGRLVSDISSSSSSKATTPALSNPTPATTSAPSSSTSSLPSAPESSTHLRSPMIVDSDSSSSDDEDMEEVEVMKVKRRKEMRAALERWENSPGLVFRVTRGSNDDWIWLYAALTRGGYTLLPSAEQASSGYPGHESKPSWVGLKRRSRSHSIDIQPSATDSSTSPPQPSASRSSPFIPAPPKRRKKSPPSPHHPTQPAITHSSSSPPLHPPLPPHSSSSSSSSSSSASSGGLSSSASAAAVVATSAFTSSPRALPVSTPVPASPSSSIPLPPLLRRPESPVARSIVPPAAGAAGSSSSSSASSASVIPPSGSALASSVSARAAASTPSSISSTPLSFAPAFDRPAHPPRRFRTSPSATITAHPAPSSPRGTSTHTADARVFVISNDLMRDHNFRMLRGEGIPSHSFDQWRERHQVKFSVTLHDKEHGTSTPSSTTATPRSSSSSSAASLQSILPTANLRFQFPQIFSHQAQVSKDGAAWHFPTGEKSASWIVFYHRNA